MKREDHEWKVVEPGKFEEGDIVWIQDKDGPTTNVGYVVLKSPDGWTFMLNNRVTVYSTINWYMAVLVEKD